jgi:hypothetical protein
VFWNIEGKNRLLDVLGSKNLDDDNLFSKQDILFLNETWSVLPFSSKKCSSFAASEAIRTEGRPSGGLEMYWAPSQTERVLSKSPCHICIQSNQLQVIGVYYKPALEFDDKIIDLVTALSACSPDLPVVLGGDFNIHESSPDFENLTEILHYHNISLVSDPRVITFDGPQGSSTPDHVFCSTHPTITSVKAGPLPRFESSHFPLVVELQLISPDRSDFGVETAPQKRLDIDACKGQLAEILPHLNDSSADELLDELCNAISSSTYTPSPAQKRNYSHEIAKLKRETKEAFKLYQKHSGLFFKEVYLGCRRELHRAVRQHKLALKHSSVAKLVEATQANGIRALYRTAKAASSSSSAVSLQDWFHFFSDLYQSFDEPVFREFASAPSEAASKLLAPFSEMEVHAALEHQSSKATSLNGTSPADLKAMSSVLAPILAKVFSSFLGGNRIPAAWLSSVFFFLHKKGAISDPNNYRSLAIEDPFLKVLTTLLTSRISDYCETHHLLPDFQFGFRKSLSTSSAVAVLKQCIETAFGKKKRVYACFVDYKKAFDLVNREKLALKLQLLGLPGQLCKLIFDILAGLKLRVRSNGAISPEFPSFNGVPQGDPLSPLLYTLYTADLPEFLDHNGVELGKGNLVIKYLLYADDLALLSHTPADIQRSLRCLEKYADKYDLTVNTTKTKCIVFHRGFCPKFSCSFNGTEIAQCNNFTYLGVVLTPQLSSGKHIQHILSKCNQRIGYLFAKLPVKSIPLPVALALFNTYVLPIVTYALPLWFPSATAEAKKRLNSMFTKFLKRYLGVPYATFNGLVHYVTGTAPLCHTLDPKVQKSFFNISYPSCMNGIRLEIPRPTLTQFQVVEHVPSFFWFSPVLSYPLPPNPEARRAILYDAFDLHHGKMCNEARHHEPHVTCVCSHCGYSVERYHFRRCPAVMFRTPCDRLKYLLSQPKR